MAKCKLCSRSGIFMTVSRYGLCSSCNSLFVMDVKRRGKIIQESLAIIKDTKNIKVGISRYDLIIEQVRALVEYEVKGIQVMERSPRENLQMLIRERDQVIYEFLEKEYDSVALKARMAATTAAKINAFSKLILLLKEYLDKCTDKSKVIALLNKAAEELSAINLEKFVSDAEKAELKGNKRKALDSYYEAYYFLTHDSIDDSLQTRAIEKIKKKIIALGGTLQVEGALNGGKTSL